MYIVIFVTAKNGREADKIASRLVKDKLIACANVIKDVKSIFSWDEKVQQANEVLLVMKSRKKCLPKIIKIIKKLHSYDVPEIIALPIVGGSAEYLDWIKDSCH